MKLTELTNCSYTGIYKITCLVDNKSYIGQAKNITSRIKSHLRSTFNNNAKDFNVPIHAAIRKYGVDNFDLAILERCADTELNIREEYWIATYHTWVQDPNCQGYNITKGGKQSIRKIKLSANEVSDIQQLLLTANLSTSEIADKYNVTASLIRNINIGKAWHTVGLNYPLRQNGCYGKQLVFGQYKYTGKAVQQVDLATNIVIRSYPSALYAAIALGDHNYNKHIAHCAAGNRNSAYGYGWKYVDITESDWQALFYQDSK